jgi:chromosome segregation ATPase
MAHEDKDDDSNSDSNSNSEVTQEQTFELLAKNDRQLKMHDELLRKGRKKIEKLTEKLLVANSKIESLSSAKPDPDEIECPSCERLQSGLTSLKCRYTERVEERDTLATELEDARKELKDAQAPIVEDVEPCESYPHLERAIADLRKRCANQARELEKLKFELEEVRVRPVLLGACKVCLTLREELEQARADFEKLSAPSTVCEACLSLRLDVTPLC